MTEVLHETVTGLDGTGQTYSLVRTYAVRVGAAIVAPGSAWVTQKVRVTVRWNSFADQSCYRAEVWTGSGWAEVVRIDGADSLMATPEGAARWPGHGMASGYVPMQHVQEKADSLEWAARLLLERATEVLA